MRVCRCGRDMEQVGEPRRYLDVPPDALLYEGRLVGCSRMEETMWRCPDHPPDVRFVRILDLPLDEMMGVPVERAIAEGALEPPR